MLTIKQYQSKYTKVTLLNCQGTVLLTLVSS
jgi:hypothetical protein